MQLVIIAGGKGTRLKEILGDRPKPMVEVGGKPLVEHQVLLARKYGIRDVLILTGYGADYIENFFGDGSAWDVRIRYQRESRPLGTAGALLDAVDKLGDTFIVMYGDTMMCAPTSVIPSWSNAFLAVMTYRAVRLGAPR